MGCQTKDSVPARRESPGRLKTAAAAADPAAVDAGAAGHAASKGLEGLSWFALSMVLKW